MPLGPPTSGFLAVLPSSVVGPPTSGPTAGVLGISLGPPTGGPTAGVPGTVLGPPTSGPALETPALEYAPLKDVSGSVVPKDLVETTDAPKIAYIRRSLAGPGVLWDDQFVTEILIGGGFFHTSTTIGKAGQTLRMAGDLDIGDDEISRVGSLTVKSDLALALSARGQSVEFNEAGDTQLNTPFFSNANLSVVAAINESLAKVTSAAGSPFVNAASGTLVAGTLVSPNGTGSVAEASAAADDVASRWAGALEASTLLGASGRVIYEGEALMNFAAGEGVGPHGKKPVFMSVTPGLATLTAPGATGQVVELVGFVQDSSSYVNGSGGTMLVQIVRAQRRVLP